eukprot:CAMPEP_0206410970 /NCGR_PEP_ID=MMETSP0294-20121207/32934_1 /ASSEMBLY_ACC=CAM_ASM_000327 /TAXON_ID=39354 /ORGANISM="Heterosigma akashiwo, Strain CCMP2393" /LENGTH=45 /DNA_ID= /DNA_START= /DNA_END= /DNA_ORIENTATION=
MADLLRVVMPEGHEKGTATSQGSSCEQIPVRNPSVGGKDGEGKAK